VSGLNGVKNLIYDNITKSNSIFGNNFNQEINLPNNINLNHLTFGDSY
jgi:hypothetical protein